MSDNVYLLTCIIKTIPFPILFLYPFKDSLRYTFSRTLWAVFICCASALGLIVLVARFPFNSQLVHMVSSFLSLFAMVFTLYVILDTDPFIMAFLVLLCKDYEDIIMLLIHNISALLPGVEPIYQELFMHSGLLGVTLPLVYLMFQKFLVPISKLTAHFSFWKYLWILPAFYYTLYRLIFYPEFYSGSFDNVPLRGLISLFWIIGILLSYFFLFCVMTETLKSSNLKEELRSAELLTQMQKEQYLMLQSNIEETKRNRHDLKQQLIVIQDYIKKQRFDESLTYIASCLDQFPGSIEVFSENYALNSIIRYYVDMAQANDIEVTADVHLDSAMVVPEVDFCTLLGNLMLNAVEGCCRQKDGRKFIYLKIASSSPFLAAIDISNSFDGQIHIRDGNFFSSKRNSEGLGTVSIRQVVMKYHGLLKYNYENRIFRASILLNLPKSR